MGASCKVSIIMPSLNVAEYIDECILSALNQTLADKEIICIDAGSTDGTWEKLRLYAEDAKYKEQITLLHSDIRSYGYQVNLGIRKAQGEYVAILETDDYVMEDMYENLYEFGKQNKADIVKADYDFFISYPNGKREFNTVRLWDRQPENYNRILNPSKIDYLYANDYNIWKGIYRRQFLLDNHITLNESKGAAFQDIGFAQQVLACAKSAYYSDKSFYRYRMDREMSSINTVHGLEYSCQEFRHLLEDEEIRNKLVCETGLYRHMAQSFYGEFVKTIRAVGYDMNSEYIKPYYEWFKPQIYSALSKGLLKEFLNTYAMLPEVLQDAKAYTRKLQAEDLIQKEREEYLLSKLINSNVVIFGAGDRGRAAIRLLLKNEVNVSAICDNDERIWGTEKYGYTILSPKECIRQYPECKYLIANKYHKDDIKNQLIGEGISEERIVMENR